MTLSKQDYRTIDSPIGPVTIVSSGEAVTAIYTAQHRRRQELAEHPICSSSVLDVAEIQLQEYFVGRRFTFDLPLQPEGTPFEQRVWQALRQIPFGVTRTYREIAVEIGKPSAARAVGAANGRNPISIVVPCHRVVGGDGKLRGYAGGLETKEWLLAHERESLAAADNHHANGRCQASLSLAMGS